MDATATNQVTKASKPGSKKGEIRRTEILDTAMRVLALEGYPEFGMRKIARRIGVHLRALQHYFPTKRDLLAAVLNHSIVKYEERMEKLIKRTSLDPDQRFVKVIKIHLSTCSDPLISGFFITLWALAIHDRDAQELMNDAYKRAAERFSILVGTVNPDLSASERMNRAIAILSMLEGTQIIVGAGKCYSSRYRSMERTIVDRLVRLAKSA